MKTPTLFKKNTFTPKKAKPRRAQSLSNLATLDANERAQELGLQYGSASLKLNGTQLKFEDGYWQSGKKYTLVAYYIIKELMSKKYLCTVPQYIVSPEVCLKLFE